MPANGSIYTNLLLVRYNIYASDSKDLRDGGKAELRVRARQASIGFQLRTPSQ